MNKWIKIILVVSLLLNFALGIAVFAGRSYFRQTTFQMLAMNAEAQARLNQYYLDEVESGDSERIKALKAFLQKGIDNCKKVAADWRKAAK